MIKSTTTAFDSLTSAQRRAATFGTPMGEKGVDAGPMLIVAGAGTGKTHIVVHRIAHLVLSGVDPARILMLTFTRRAAQEMLWRIQAIVAEALLEQGKAGDRSVISRLRWSGTFHALGSRILRLYAKHLGLDPNFTLLDRSDAAELMDRTRHDLGFAAKEKRFPRTEVCFAIYAYRVNTRLSLPQILQEQFPSLAQYEPELTRLYREYVGRKQKNRAMDSEDLLLYWHVMMQNPSLAKSLAKNFDHILVDEYQEVSTLQEQILQGLKADGKGLTVVGDDAQAIYSFRAAATENILGFADRYKPKPEVVVLAQNYRSTQSILDVANALIADGARQHRKTLLGARQATQKPFYIAMDEDVTQAEYITAKILQTREIGGSLKRHAVLFRHWHHSEALEAELTKRNIPFMKYGGTKFVELAHVKDVISVLRWVGNPRNLLAAFRVLKLLPEMGSEHVKQVLEYFAAQNFNFKGLAAFDAPQAIKIEWKRFCTMLEKLVDPATPWVGQVAVVREWYKPQLERIYDAAWSRMGDLEQLDALSVQYSNRERFLTELTLEPPAFSSDRSSNASKDEEFVTLSTIHAAKGQEWDIVYVLNVSDGNFPSESSASNPEMIEEERRLLYVAMTRARVELHLCAPLKFGSTQRLKEGDPQGRDAKSKFMTDKVLECCERTSRNNVRGMEILREEDTATVDIAAQLKEMW